MHAYTPLCLLPADALLPAFPCYEPQCVRTRRCNCLRMMHVSGVGVLPCIQDDSTPVSIFICE